MTQEFWWFIIILIPIIIIPFCFLFFLFPLNSK